MTLFSEIERTYRANLSEQRFWSYYLSHALPITVLAIVIAMLLNVNIWLLMVIIAIVIFWFVGRFFDKDMRRVIDTDQLPRKFQDRLHAYAKADEKIRIDGLVSGLRRANIKNRADLELAIHYFETQRPIVTKTSLLEWVLSIAITLMSVVAIAYDDELQAVNAAKLTAIFWPTIRIVAVIVVPIIVIGALVSKIFFSRTKIDSILIEDLAYIYFNFDQFEHQL